MKKLFFGQTGYQNYLKIIYRQMKRSKAVSILNVAGMTLALLVSMGIYAYISHELSYDRYHAEADRVHRLTYRFQNAEGYDIHWARMNQSWVNQLETEFPEIQKLVRFQSFRTRDVSVGQDNYREQFAFATDPEVFELFDLEVVKGSREASLKPYSTVLTETAARKYFGDKEPLDATIRVTNDMGEKESYKVVAVIKDPPANTHLPIHLLTSINREEDRRGSAYTYVLLDEYADINELNAKITDFALAQEDRQEGDILTVQLQPLTDIHLHSHLSREIVANGDVQNLVIFGLVGFFLMVIASVNFINLNMVRSMDRLKEFSLRKTLGAAQWEHLAYLTYDALVFCMTSAVIATVIFFVGMPSFEQFLGHGLVFEPVKLLVFIMVCVLMITGLSAVLASIPLLGVLRKPLSRTISYSSSYKSGARGFLLGLQFAAVLALVSSLIIIQRQFSYMTQQNLGFNSDQVIVLQDNNRTVMRQYDRLKSELMKFPEVQDVTAVMQVPSTAIRDQGTVTLADDPSLAVAADIQVIDLNASKMLEMEFLAGTDLPAHLRQEMNTPDSILWRDFTTKARGYLINESAAKRLGWQNPQEAIGQQINWSIGGISLNHGPVAGVIRDFHQESLAEEIRPLVMTYEPLWISNMLVKTKTDQVFAWHDRLELFWKEQFPDQPMQWSYLDEKLNQIYSSEKRQLTLITVFTTIAVFIAFVGLYVMIMYAVRRRLRELAIRQVLGSKWTDQLLLLGRGYLLIVLLSMVVAFPAVYWPMQSWMSGYAYHITLEGFAFLLAGALLLVILLLTLVFQVFKNRQTNPATVLAVE